MRIAALLAVSSLVAIAGAPAFAGDTVLEGRAPAWVDEANLDGLDLKKGPAELIADSQYRLEGGTVVSYFDSAVRIDNSDTLMDKNTLSLSWMPDKGDLTIHALEIVREGKTIDVMASGAEFDVIRREQGLENRLLDGELTATMSIPGLRVGDVLRTSYSITTRDQALGDEMQILHYLGRSPWRVGLGRAIVSWPEGDQVFWKAEEAAKLGEPVLRDGYRYLTVKLPLEEGKTMPEDAPSRYSRALMLRVGSFADWAELSRVMAPHFLAASEVADGSEVALQAAAIMKQSDDPLERAQLATRLVQDKVSYLLNGLNGGNYLPQDAQFTWEKRYGDCKAKTTLLLSLLRRMGIEAEPALVVSRGGDALPELLALPGDFDHVIVRAVIEGKEYWLDGTSTGTRMYNIADVPTFTYALPLRTAGADLTPMASREKTYPDMKISGTVDHSAGVDFPQIFNLTMEVAGAAGARAERLADAADPEIMRRLASTFAASGPMEGGVLSSVALTYDKEAAVARIVLTGVGNSAFDWDGGELIVRDDSTDPGISFNPDRARRDWRDIPVATSGPSMVTNELTLILPDGGKGFTLDGTQALTGEYANTRIVADSSLADGAVRTVSNVWQRAGEVRPEDVAGSKREALRIAAAVPKLKAPAEVTWRWDLNDAQRRAKAAPVLKAYDEAIAFAREDDFAPLIAKAGFLTSIYQFDEALTAYNQLIEKSPEAWAYNDRSYILIALGRREDAIADLRESYDLDPSNETAFALAEQLAFAGKADEGLSLLEDLPVTDEEQGTFSDTWAKITGLKGDKRGGLALLVERVAAKPEDPELLNAECWFRGLFDEQVDDALPGCTRAIERAEEPASALDSRAMVEYRRGNHTAAMADLEAALKLNPSLAASRYLRGIIRVETGDKSGAEDIATALRMEPHLADFYGRHGVRPRT